MIFLMNKSDLEQRVTEKDILSYLGSIRGDSTKELSGISMISTSAILGEGLERLEKEIENLMFEGKVEKNDEIMIMSLRHKEALTNALSALLLVKKSLEDHMPEDFYSIDLMEAYADLGSIIGEEVGDDLVEEIFSKFCMGK